MECLVLGFRKASSSQPASLVCKHHPGPPPPRLRGTGHRHRWPCCQVVRLLNDVVIYSKFRSPSMWAEDMCAKIRMWSFNWGLQDTGYIAYWSCHFELTQSCVLGSLLRQWSLLSVIILCPCLIYSPNFDLSGSFSLCAKNFFFSFPYSRPGLCSSCAFLITEPSFISAS